jgi:hypothetical protein
MKTEDLAEGADQNGHVGEPNQLKKLVQNGYFLQRESPPTLWVVRTTVNYPIQVQVCGKEGKGGTE